MVLHIKKEKQKNRFNKTMLYILQTPNSFQIKN